MGKQKGEMYLFGSIGGKDYNTENRECEIPEIVKQRVGQVIIMGSKIGVSSNTVKSNGKNKYIEKLGNGVTVNYTYIDGKNDLEIDWEYQNPKVEKKVSKKNKGERYIKIYGENGKRYESSAVAEKNMKTITIPIWQYSEKLKVKVSGKHAITVNKKIADEVLKIFTEIYNDSEKFPIKTGTTAGYCWRGDKDTSQHKDGLAIDINWNDNKYMKKVKENGKIKWKTILGVWEPGKNIYSMPLNGSVVRIFKKYGWDWGGDWINSKDYMHFSYLGG
jgi:hypothetical protein